MPEISFFFWILEPEFETEPTEPGPLGKKAADLKTTATLTHCPEKNTLPVSLALTRALLVILN